MFPTVDLEIFHQVIIGLVCNFLVLDCGLHEGWATPTLGKFGRDDPITLTSNQEAFVLNMMYLGVAIGTLMPLVLMDRIGRKRTLLIAAIPKTCSWIVMGLADTPNILYLARILAGIGCGMSYTVMPMYTGEISSKRTRGALCTINSVSLNLGVLFIYTVGLSISRSTMAMISLAFPLLFIITFVWLPESAIYLTRNNHLERAEKVLQWTLGKENVKEELEEIKKIVFVEDKIQKIGFIASVKKATKSPANRRACWIGFILLNALGITGVAPLLAFQSHIYEEAGFDNGDIAIMAAGVAIVLSGVVCMLVVKCFGKRRILLLSGPVYVCSQLTISIFFTLVKYGIDVKPFNWIPCISIVIYTVIYGFAFNTMPLVYMGEIFSVDIKVVAGVFSVLYYAISTTISIQVYQSLFDAFGTFASLWQLTVITFIIYCLICVYVPETEGKSLAEIQTMLSQGFVRRTREEENAVKPVGGGTEAVDIGVYSLKRVSVIPTSNNSIN